VAIKWLNGMDLQSELYAEANMLNIETNSLINAESQETIYNTNTLNAWLNAKMQGFEQIAEFYERRFLLNSR
jgi:hypothetical protein